MNKNILIAGDGIAIALLTIIGFAIHGETDTSFLPRMAASFFPVLAGWFCLAPWFGLFTAPVVMDLKMWWRIPLAVLFSAPLAAVLRAVILGSTAIPLFVLVLGSTSAMGMLVWRILFVFISKRMSK